MAAAATPVRAAARLDSTTENVAAEAVRKPVEDGEPIRLVERDEPRRAAGNGAAVPEVSAALAEHGLDAAAASPASVGELPAAPQGVRPGAATNVGQTEAQEASRQAEDGSKPAEREVAARVKDGSAGDVLRVENASSDGLADALRQAALDALLGSGKQVSAGEALEDAEWRMIEGVLRVQTGFSKAMLGMVLNPEAEKVARAAILKVNADAGGGALKIEWLPGTPAEKKAAGPKRAARSGSAQAKAEEHPIVKQAQELFHAEIRKVIDLSGK